MKIKLYLFLLFLCIGCIVQAQTAKVVNVTAGNLYASLTETERNTITSLTITGSIDARDFKTMRDKMPLLNELDISGTNITEYKGNEGTNDNNYTEYPVHSIPSYAFSSFFGGGKTNLNRVVFPASLTSIGVYAFSGCSGLKSLTIPSSVVRIDEGTFSRCTGLTFLDLPSSITYLGQTAFSNCTGLTSVNLPSSLTTIGRSAYSSCSGLTSIIIPESVTKLEEGAFAGCSGLTSVTFPKSLTQLAPYAFSSCTGLTSVTIPEWFTSISYGAFANCKNLKTVSILSPSTIIYDNAFENCINITSLALATTAPPEIYSNSFWGVDRKLCILKVPFGTTSKYRENIYWNSFVNISEPSKGISLFGSEAKVASSEGSRATVNIAANVAWTASSDQPWLTVSPGSGTGNQAITFTAQANPTVSFRAATVTFSSTGFESKTFTITQSGIDACFTNVTPGSLITTLSSDELATITNLRLTGSIDARDFKTMNDKMPMLNTLDLSGVTIIAYEGTEGTMPNLNSYAANTIPERAFTNGILKSKFTSITLPRSVTVIANNTFSSGLSSLTVNWQIPIALDRNFNPLYYVQKDCILRVPYGTASTYSATEGWKDFIHIEQAAKGFIFNTLNDTISGTEGSTTTVDITANMAYTISSDQSWLVANPTSGNGNQKITLTAKANELLTKRKVTVTVSGAGVSSQSITIIQNFQPQPEKILEVTAGGLATALSADELNAISILTLKGTIDARDFKTMRDRMPLLTTLDLSGATIVAYSGTEGTTYMGSTIYQANTIPEYAFRNMYGNGIYKSGLTNIKLPSTLTSIGAFAFNGCKALKTITIPAAVNWIREYAFDGCTSLTSLDLPTSASIGTNAFSNCTGLTSLTIPQGTTSIGYAAFSGCQNLTNVSILSPTTSIDSWAFSTCTKISSLTVSWNGPIKLNDNPFYGVDRKTCIVHVPYGTASKYKLDIQWKDFVNIIEPANGIYLSANSINVASAGGTTSTIYISSNIVWQASSDNAWLSVNASSGTGLEQKLIFTAEANTLGSPRKATVTVSAPGIESQTIAVTQMPAPAKIEVTAGSLSTALTAEELNTITDLTITGTIDARDFKTIRDKMPLLSSLDLSGAKIIAYNGYEGTSNWGDTNYPANTIPSFALYKSPDGKLNLTSVIFPESITSIAQYAFCMCKGLTKITIPSSVSSIMEQAFAYCTNLTSITMENPIPPDLSSSYQVFYQVNKNLCVLNIPFNSAADYKNAYQWKDFINITAASNGFRVSKNKLNVGGTAGSYATISIFSNIEWTATSDQDWLKVTPLSGNDSVSITFTAEENPSFLNARTAYVTISSLGVKSQTITVIQSGKPQPPKTFEIIAGGLVSALTDEELATVTDLTLTGSMDARDFKTIRDRMPLLARLDLSQVTIVAYSGTEGTKGIEQTTYPANTIPEYAFVMQNANYRGNYTLTNIVFPESLTAIGPYSFSYCFALKDFVIPSSVLNIEKYAFFGCKGISNISIPSSVTEIGLLAFGALKGRILVDSENSHYMSSNNVLFNKAQTELIQCVEAKSGIYDIPSTVTTIDDYAFYARDLLTSVIIPSSVATIGKDVFSYCNGLTTLTIPSSVTSIGEYGFSYCYGLRTIYANAKVPVNLDSSPSVFSQIYSCILYVPVGSKTTYQSASQWKNFYNIIEINPDLIANAGFDKSADEGQVVTLEGSVSVNTSGKRLTFKWTAPEGITLNSDTVANPTFTAPEVKYYTDFTFSLTISDGLNYSAPDQVVVLVRNVNRPPVANAGVDRTVNENSITTLDGSGSFDPDGDYLSYEWTAPYPIILSSRYASKPTFTSPNVSIDTKFTFYLSVNDGYMYKTDTVIITVKNINQLPVANAGDMHVVSEGETVFLDGRRSSDADGDALTYKWTAPEGITLNSLTSATPSFVVPKIESDTWLTFNLVVNDGKVNSLTSQVNVFVRNKLTYLHLLAKTVNLETGIPVNYKLFMYDGNSFVQKRDTFAVTGDSLHILIEPGYWIALVSPTRDPSAFIPTYSGDVLSWNDAKIISIPERGDGYFDIMCKAPQTVKTGVGQIAGSVYEKSGDGIKSISIARAENLATANPVKTALVQLYKKGNAIPVASVFTDDQGAYKFGKLEIADYEIKVDIPGYLQSEKFPVALSNLVPSTSIWFAVNTAMKIITDNNAIEVSMVKAYPNPTSGIVHISGLTKNTKIEVYTMDGKLIIKKEAGFTSETIDINNQVSGTYVFVINDQRFKIFKK